MRNLYILAICFSLASCATISSTKKPENLTTFSLNAGYQTAFRIIDENLKTCFPAGYVQSVLYPDQQRANITVADNQLSNVVWFLADIKGNGNDSSTVDFYSVYAKQKGRISKFKEWVNEGKSGCS